MANRKTKKWNCAVPGHSLSKIWIKSYCGKKANLNGRDWKHDKSPTRDIKIGIERLVAMVNKNKHRIEIAIIYDKRKNIPVMEFRNGVWKEVAK